jgi:hypothetical protein
MRISVEINGVETKFTCLSSVVVLIFAIMMLVASIVKLAQRGDGWNVIPGLLLM